jgi:small GTP-binding protein
LTSDGKSLLFRQYAAVKIDQDLLAGFLSAFSGFMKEISQSEIKSTITGNSKFFYGIEQGIIVVLAADIDDKDEEVSPKVENLLNKFIELYGEIFRSKKWNGERTHFNPFYDYIDKIVLTPIKVSIIGYAGMGKSSLLRLICGKDINLEYIPTITADIATFNGLGKRQIALWDFAGQIQFSDLWQGLLRGTRIALLVTDSTYKSANDAKKILTDLIQRYYKDVIVIGIANKQDLPNHLTPKFVEKILNIPTYGMIATNADYRALIHEIISKAIDEVNRRDGLKLE